MVCRGAGWSPASGRDGTRHYKSTPPDWLRSVTFARSRALIGGGAGDHGSRTAGAAGIVEAGSGARSRSRAAADRGEHAVEDAMPEPSYDKFQSLIAEQLGVDVDKVTPEASFTEDLKADSLDLVEMVMAFEEEYGMEISDEDAQKLRTVGEAWNYVKGKVQVA